MLILLSRTATSPLAPTNLDRVPPELRSEQRPTVKSNSSLIDASLLNRIYETQYAQKVKEPDNSNWKFQIKFNQDIVSAEQAASGRIHLTMRDRQEDTLHVDDFDLVVSATGFTRTSPNETLSSVTSKRLLDGPSLSTNGEYAVNIRRGLLEKGAGLWCIGLIGEPEQAVGESAFIIMAERSRRVAKSLIDCDKSEEEAAEDRKRQVQAQL